MPEKVSKALAAGRLDRIGGIMYNTRDREEVVVNLLADYAMGGGGAPIDVLKQRAKKRVEERRAA